MEQLPREVQFQGSVLHGAHRHPLGPSLAQFLWGRLTFCRVDRT